MINVKDIFYYVLVSNMSGSDETAACNMCTPINVTDMQSDNQQTYINVANDPSFQSLLPSTSKSQLENDVKRIKSNNIIYTSTIL